MIKRILIFIILFSFCFAEDKGGDAKFPKVKIQDLKGKSVYVQDLLDGKLTMVSFWATWCVPCLKEMKYLNQFHVSFTDQGFQVIGISTDDTRSARRVPSVIKSKKVTYPILLDTEQVLFNRFQSSAMPFSVLVSPEGKILWEHTGYIAGDEKKMEEVILSYLTDNTEEKKQEKTVDKSDDKKDSEPN